MTNKQKQNLLQFLGLYDGAIDGIWGPASRNALTEFQRSSGISATGDADIITLEALLKAVATWKDPANDINVGGKVDADNPYQHWWEDIEFFDPDEMKCKCKGKYCDGFPHEIQPLLMQILDRARRWSGNPIQVISGLRCETHNRNEKGHANSQHMYGEAVDVYFYGVSVNAALAWLQSQPDVRYAYRIAGCNNIHFDIQPVGR
jgi:peptidoglycan hydrolase-like protein with peptidoglycan-binding domain